MTTSLLDAARDVRERAYVPYSKFKVGAAIRGASGTVYRGCNVENVAYPEGTCAEAGAIAAMVAAGETQLIEVAVIADSPTPVPPCGGCRQKLAEFASGRGAGPAGHDRRRADAHDRGRPAARPVRRGPHGAHMTDPRPVISAIRDGRGLDGPGAALIAQGLADGSVSDAQAGAFAMAVLTKGVGPAGRVALTRAMRDSGMSCNGTCRVRWWTSIRPAASAIRCRWCWRRFWPRGACSCR